MNKLCILKRKRRNQNQQKKDLAETMIDRDQTEKMVVHPMKKEVRKLLKTTIGREEIKKEIKKVNKEEEMITEEIILQKKIMKIIKKEKSIHMTLKAL